MKILIRNSDNVVIYAEPALTLWAEGAHGDWFADGRVARFVQAIDFLQVIDRLCGVVALPVARSEGFGPAGAHGADLAVVDLGGAERAFEAMRARYEVVIPEDLAAGDLASIRTEPLAGRESPQ